MNRPPASLQLRGADGKKFRLVTRSDFDGLVCATLLRELDLIDEIVFVHPKDVQDGKVAIDARDILTNLPYVEAAHLVFDHHSSEVMRLGTWFPDNHILNPNAASAARVVYDYFGGRSAFPNAQQDMLDAVDKVDSAFLALEEVLNPTGWVLLSFLTDARTGLGRFKSFTISNYQLMMKLIEYCREFPVHKILELPDVAERRAVYQAHVEPAREQIQRCAKVRDNVVVLDLRGEETIYATNRFMIYSLFPQCNLSVHVLWGLNRQNTVLAIGHSIFNETSHVDVGELTLALGGGGHAHAGTCQVPNETADEILESLLQRISEIDERTADRGIPAALRRVPSQYLS